MSVPTSIEVCLHRQKLVYYAWMNDVRQHSNVNINFTLVGLLLEDEKAASASFLVSFLRPTCFFLFLFL